MKEAKDKENERFNAAAVGVIESILLAHASAGVDVSAPCYIAGIEEAYEAIGNKL